MNWMMFNFPNSNSLMMENLIMFHDYIMMINFMIISMIIYLIYIIIMNKFNNKMMMDNQNIEFMNIILTFIIIIIITFKSIKLLYLNNEMKMNIMTIKIMSNQWFWMYEYMNFNMKFNSYIYLNKNFNFYLLETDNNLIIPFNYQIQFIITSLDVIHSWTIPSMNLKMDSIPNYLNQLMLMSYKPSIMFGQCSEICGMNHSFMPISMETIKFSNFNNWLKMN